MTDSNADTQNADTQTVTDTQLRDAQVRSFSEAEIRAAQELHSTVVVSEQTGAAARITQAFALYDLHRTGGYEAVTSEKTGTFFTTWQQYVQEVVVSSSEAAVSKAEKVASLLGNEDPGKLAKAGIEKLYDCLRLSDRKVITLDQVVDYATTHTALQIRSLLNAKSSDKERRYPLTEFTVTKATQDRFSGVLQVFRNALKQSDNGGEPSDWQVVDALTETLATLDPGYILETVSGEGGNGPRQSSTFTQTPPTEVMKWVAGKYIEDGHDPEDFYRMMKDAVSGELERIKDEREVQARQEKADELDRKAAAKKADQMKNKLVKLSSNIQIEGVDGSTYMVTDIFKDSNNAHVKSINESATPALTLPEGGALVSLDDLAVLTVSAVKVRVEKPKAEKPAPAQFSKQAQTAKGKKAAPAKTASKKATPKKAAEQPAEEEQPF